MLDKLGGVFAPKPSPGPHKERECLPLAIILRNRLKYALTFKETNSILMKRQIKVDGKVRTDKCYPAGLMDVIDIEKTDEHFRLVYDSKGRFVMHRITKEEAQYKLGKVKQMRLGDKGVPFVVLHDGRTIRYPDPMVKVNDTVVVDIASNKITDYIKFDVGQMVIVVGGRNAGRVGQVQNREKHKGSFEIIHILDAAGHAFATRLSNCFVIGEGQKPMISLPKGKGIKLTIVEELEKKTGHKVEA
jgi:small subunit ribosomal protein S4e